MDTVTLVCTTAIETMPPKKKKTICNGFSMYMLEIQREIFEEEGRRVPIPQLVEVANPQWKALPADQKTYYNEEAKRYKKQQRNGAVEGPGRNTNNAADNRMDTTGNYVSKRVSVADQLKQRRELDRKLLTQSWPEGNGICDVKFYFIAFQTLCVLPDKMGYLPCEMACTEYTLRGGISKVFHRFLRPGPIPMGYRYMCQSNSDNTHQIPVAGHEEATANYQQVWRDLMTFINPDNHRVTPLIFCQSADREMVEWSLSWLAERAGISNSLRKVIEVELLMTELYCHAEEVAHSWSTFHTMMGDSKWDHMNDTRCEYHEDLDVAIHKCALGVVKKYCFHMSDPIAVEVYNISLTDKHLPERIDTNDMASMVYPKIASTMSYDKYPREVPQHKPPVARIYRPQAKQHDIPDQPIRRPTTDFTSSSSMAAQHSNQYYASTEPTAPSPSSVPMPNFQWQTKMSPDPNVVDGGVEQLGQNLQPASLQSRPGIGRGIGRGLPVSRNGTPSAAIGIGRGIGRGFRGY